MLIDISLKSLFNIKDTEEQGISIPVFDIEQDLQYYHCDFLKHYSISKKDMLELDFFYFYELLSGLYLYDSAISKVIEIRSWSKNEHSTQQEIQHYTVLQAQYALNGYEDIQKNVISNQLKHSINILAGEMIHNLA